MKESVRGEDVPEPRQHGRRRRWIVVALLAVTLCAGCVGVGARWDRAVHPGVDAIVPGAEQFRLAARTAGAKAQARERQAPTPDDDDLDAIGALALAASLAVIVRMADRLPQGHPDRQALADASRPLNAALYRREVLA